MSMQDEDLTRILIVARIQLGRALVDVLVGGPFHAFRTPSAIDLIVACARIQPHLVIIALDLYGQDVVGAALALKEAKRDLPIIMLGDPPASELRSEFHWAPADVRPMEVRSVASTMLNISRNGREPHRLPDGRP